MVQFEIQESLIWKNARPVTRAMIEATSSAPEMTVYNEGFEGILREAFSLTPEKARLIAAGGLLSIIEKVRPGDVERAAVEMAMIVSDNEVRDFPEFWNSCDEVGNGIATGDSETVMLHLNLLGFHVRQKIFDEVLAPTPSEV